MCSPCTCTQPFSGSQHNNFGSIRILSLGFLDTKKGLDVLNHAKFRLINMPDKFEEVFYKVSSNTTDAVRDQPVLSQQY
eukprot:7439538-Pyramimonas_sp.AAC.2